jgi:hypothetical protein
MFACVWQWWEGRNAHKRRYLLERARCLYDTSMTHQHTPAAPVPAFLQARVAAGEALPLVDVVPSEQEEHSATGGTTRASSEAHAHQQAELQAERHAVLSYVTTTMNEQLFTEFMQGFSVPQSFLDAEVGGGSSVTQRGHENNCVRRDGWAEGQGTRLRMGLACR